MKKILKIVLKGLVIGFFTTGLITFVTKYTGYYGLVFVTGVILGPILFSICMKE